MSQLNSREHEGNSLGETCNRERCQGVIEYHDIEGCCSCHNNPPCSYCTTPRGYCPVCGWDDAEEQNEQERFDRENFDQDAYDKQQKSYANFQQEFQEKRNLFYDRFYGRKPIEEYEIRLESHTHFTQKVYGIHPEGFEIPMDEIRGTFGGRFICKDKTRFIYIAYTD